MNAYTTVSRCSTSSEDLSRLVVDLVAASEGVDPVELAEPLYSVVDPDALDELFRSQSGEEGSAQGHVRFEYLGYDVTVRSDGEVRVVPA